ncbi:MAG: sulfite exporter TauE/SafE family protein [Patescibacteria group bacterium]|nr:cytochrome c biogenesis protein CcdA [Patescibacteria group bacterium]MDE2015505.1 sulfite exporter TauE/SafE family protein [Patescibacteria group bacterium]MDE2226879.1 sulfite exporter TauE/SafE family protein [Patescibacteria group bacterium]
MLNIPIVVAFVAGIVSFLSPCVLPIIPGFLAYLAGESSSGASKSSRSAIFLNSLFFVIGFSVVFAILGVLLNSVLSHAAYAVQDWLARIGGALIIFFGLYLMGFFKISFLEFDHKMRVGFGFRSRYLTSLAFGFAFAAGWTPCVGPILGGILGLAASAPGEAFYLLLSYAIGLGIPFLVVGALAARASSFINRYADKLEYVTKVFGAVLVVLGVLVFTQSLQLVANFDFVNNFLLNHNL